MNYIHPDEYKGLKFNSPYNQLRIKAIVEKYCLKCDLFMGNEHDFSECQMYDKRKNGKIAKHKTCPFDYIAIPLDKETLKSDIKCKLELYEKNNEDFNTLNKELVNISNEILKYYDIDKIKPYSVSIWTKENEGNENVFDIEADELVVYNERHIVKEEAQLIVNRIQEKLKEILEIRKY